jgi:iron(III) transport system substrate-binding protein
MKIHDLLIALLLLVTAPLAGAQEVNVYNARHYSTDEQLYSAFTDSTGIRVNVVEGNHDELIQRMLAEGEQGPADLLITVDAGRLALAAAEDLLQPVTTPVLEKAVPANLHHPDGLWYGISVRARVLVYARERIKPEDLSTYEALADPQFQGKILSRSSSYVYTTSLVGSIIEAIGPEKTEQWAEGVVANFARPPEGGDTDQIRAVAAGQGDIAIVNTYYIARLINSDKPEDRAVAEKIAVFFPNQQDRGTHVNISGAAVTKYAPHRDNAIKLLEYLVTEGQRYFADVNFEYPVNPEFASHTTLAAFGDFKQDNLNAATFAANSKEALMIMDRAGWK